MKCSTPCLGRVWVNFGVVIVGNSAIIELNLSLEQEIAPKCGAEKVVWPRGETKVFASTSYLCVRSTNRELALKKSAPSRGFPTSATTKDQSYVPESRWSFDIAAISCSE